jgi:hypothetical protein
MRKTTSPPLCYDKKLYKNNSKNYKTIIIFVA